MLKKNQKIDFGAGLTGLPARLIWDESGAAAGSQYAESQEIKTFEDFNVFNEYQRHLESLDKNYPEENSQKAWQARKKILLDQARTYFRHKEEKENKEKGSPTRAQRLAKKVAELCRKEKIAEAAEEGLTKLTQGEIMLHETAELKNFIREKIKSLLGDEFEDDELKISKEVVGLEKEIYKSIQKLLDKRGHRKVLEGVSRDQERMKKSADKLRGFFVEPKKRKFLDSFFENPDKKNWFSGYSSTGFGEAVTGKAELLKKLTERGNETYWDPDKIFVGLTRPWQIRKVEDALHSLEELYSGYAKLVDSNKIKEKNTLSTELADAERDLRNSRIDIDRKLLGAGASRQLRGLWNEEYLRKKNDFGHMYDLLQKKDDPNTRAIIQTMLGQYQKEIAAIKAMEGETNQAEFNNIVRLLEVNCKTIRKKGLDIVGLKSSAEDKEHHEHFWDYGLYHQSGIIHHDFKDKADWLSTRVVAAAGVWSAALLGKNLLLGPGAALGAGLLNSGAQQFFFGKEVSPAMNATTNMATGSTVAAVAESGWSVASGGVTAAYGAWQWYKTAEKSAHKKHKANQAIYELIKCAEDPESHGVSLPKLILDIEAINDKKEAWDKLKESIPSGKYEKLKALANFVQASTNKEKKPEDSNHLVSAIIQENAEIAKRLPTAGDLRDWEEIKSELAQQGIDLKNAKNEDLKKILSDTQYNRLQEIVNKLRAISANELLEEFQKIAKSDFLTAAWGFLDSTSAWTGAIASRGAGAIVGYQAAGVAGLEVGGLGWLGSGAGAAAGGVLGAGAGALVGYAAGKMLWHETQAIGHIIGKRFQKIEDGAKQKAAWTKDWVSGGKAREEAMKDLKKGWEEFSLLSSLESVTTLDGYVTWYSYHEIEKIFHTIVTSWEKTRESKVEDKVAHPASKLLFWRPEVARRILEEDIQAERGRADTRKKYYKNRTYDQLMAELSDRPAKDKKRAILEALADRGNLRMSDRHLIELICPGHFTQKDWAKADAKIDYTEMREAFKHSIDFEYIGERGYGQELLDKQTSGFGNAEQAGQKLSSSAETASVPAELGIFEIQSERSPLEGEGKTSGMIDKMVDRANAFSTNGESVKFKLKIDGVLEDRVVEGDMGAVGLKLTDLFMRKIVSRETLSKISKTHEGGFNPFSAFVDILAGQSGEPPMCKFEEWGWIDEKRSTVTKLGFEEIPKFFNTRNALDKNGVVRHVATDSSTYRRHSRKHTNVNTALTAGTKVGEKLLSYLMKNSGVEVFGNATELRSDSGAVNSQKDEIAALIKSAVEDIIDGGSIMNTNERYIDNFTGKDLNAVEREKLKKEGREKDIIAMGAERYDRGMQKLIRILGNLWLFSEDREIVKVNGQYGKDKNKATRSLEGLLKEELSHPGSGVRAEDREKILKLMTVINNAHLRRSNTEIKQSKGSNVAGANQQRLENLFKMSIEGLQSLTTKDQFEEGVAEATKKKKKEAEEEEEMAV